MNDDVSAPGSLPIWVPHGMVVDAVQQRLNLRPRRLGRHRHRVRGVIRATPLSGRAGQGRPDRRDQADVRGGVTNRTLIRPTAVRSRKKPS